MRPTTCRSSGSRFCLAAHDLSVKRLTVSTFTFYCVSSTLRPTTWRSSGSRFRRSSFILLRQPRGPRPGGQAAHGFDVKVSLCDVNPSVKRLTFSTFEFYFVTPTLVSYPSPTFFVALPLSAPFRADGQASGPLAPLFPGRMRAEVLRTWQRCLISISRGASYLSSDASYLTAEVLRT